MAGPQYRVMCYPEFESSNRNCGIDRTYLSLLERGERQPTLSTLFALVDRLGVAPEALVAQMGKALPK